MKKVCIIVVPAEGDSVQTTQPYIKALKQYYYKQKLGVKLSVRVFSHPSQLPVIYGTHSAIITFFQSLPKNEKFEIHAQGGLGAFVACEMRKFFPEKIGRIFFIGGAPCTAMTPLAKFFHRYVSRIWYYSPIKFFADDPWHYDAEIDEVIDEIRASSTACMRADPKLYWRQLSYIGRWELVGYEKFKPEEAFFIPNGETIRSSLRDNTYDNSLARIEWMRHGVRCLPQPGNFFSFYSLMPAEELFKIMDDVRSLSPRT